MHTFDFSFNYEKYEDLTLLAALCVIQELLADEGSDVMSFITSHLTGEVINNSRFKVYSYDNSEPTIYDGVEHIMNLAPYLKYIKEIYCDNYLVYKKWLEIS